MERIVVDRTATLYKTFYVDGVPTDPDAPPVVTVTRSDGSTVVAGGVINETDAGTWSVTIPSTSSTLLDTLTVTWVATVNATAQTHVDTVEVAGGVLFTIADARRIKPLDSVASFPTDSIVAMRATVEDALERACGVAFVPRYTLETHPAGPIVPRWPYVQRIRSITVDGVDYTQAQLDETAFSPLGGITFAAGWPRTGSIIVGYEHGHSYTPPEITRAALILTKMWLGAQNRPVDDRAITFNTTDGGTYSLAVPGRNGSEFGHPDVDVAVQRYGMRVGVA